MKKYDHEPTMTELFDQLTDEYAFLPDFIPPIKIPIIGKIIKKKIKHAMVVSFADTMFT